MKPVALASGSGVGFGSGRSVHYPTLGGANGHHRGQAREAYRRDPHDDVPHRDIEEAAGNQVDRDAPEPDGDDPREQARPRSEEYPDAGDDLDDAYQIHERGGTHRDQTAEGGW